MEHNSPEHKKIQKMMHKMPKGKMMDDEEMSKEKTESYRKSSDGKMKKK